MKKVRDPVSTKMVLAFDENDYALIERASGIGVTEEKIGALVGLKRAQWFKMKQEDDRVVEIFQTSRVNNEYKVAGKLMEIIENDKHRGQLQAIIFWLKTRAEWRDPNGLIAAAQQIPDEIGFKDIEVNEGQFKDAA